LYGSGKIAKIGKKSFSRKPIFRIGSGEFCENPIRLLQKSCFLTQNPIFAKKICKHFLNVRRSSMGFDSRFLAKSEICGIFCYILQKLCFSATPIYFLVVRKVTRTRIELNAKWLYIHAYTFVYVFFPVKFTIYEVCRILVQAPSMPMHTYNKYLGILPWRWRSLVESSPPVELWVVRSNPARLVALKK
jgi:hypothetical protein